MKRTSKSQKTEVPFSQKLYTWSEVKKFVDIVLKACIEEHRQYDEVQRHIMNASINSLTEQLKAAKEPKHSSRSKKVIQPKTLHEILFGKARKKVGATVKYRNRSEKLLKLDAAKRKNTTVKSLLSKCKEEDALYKYMFSDQTQ
jgi:hypothetical protein